MENKKYTGCQFIDALRREGIELDQRMHEALCLAGGMTETPNDAHLFLALYRLNSITNKYLDLDLNQIEKYSPLESLRGSSIRTHIRKDAETFYFSEQGIIENLLNYSLSNRKETNTFGVLDFINGIIHYGNQTGDHFTIRPYTIDLLNTSLGITKHAPLKNNPKLRSLMYAIKASNEGAEDFQYLLSLERGRIAFRVTSVLNDFIQETPSGLLVPRRAILTHFKDQFGGFTQDEIEELEDLINSRSYIENDFQRFFENHSHFFRKWDYREVYAQVHLSKENQGDLIPDFILTDRDFQKAAIIELKLPTPRIIRRQRNRDRFATAIMEARAQLLRYRDWFRSEDNRKKLKNRVGMEIYEPQLSVIIGRASEFYDDLDRQQLQADISDIEIVTYDDILKYAERRRIVFC